MAGVLDALNASPKRAAIGINRALAKAAQFAAGRLAADLARETDLPRRIFGERRRIRIGTTPTGRRVWLGYAAINARYATPIKQHDFGATARSYVFPGSFLAPIPSADKPGIFRRTGIFKRPARGRYQGWRREVIAAEQIALPQAPAVANRVAEATRQRMEKLVTHELAFALGLIR